MPKIKQLFKLLIDRRPVNKITVNVLSLPKNELLKGRVALITGGTSGIGYAIARAFLNSGATIIITGRSQERVNRTLAELDSPCVYGFPLDNTNVSEFEKIFAEICSTIHLDGVNGMDILVNNAGVNYSGMPDAKEDEYDKVMDTNLKGAFFLSQLFGKYLIENKVRGNILNIASASSIRPANSAYILSKWGLRGLTLGLAKSLGPKGITVNGIAPGPTATPMMKKATDANLALDRIPLGRYILPEEIANMAVFLVSDMGRSVMGDIVFMTGGAGNLTLDDMDYSF